jgi:PPOX class probable F420-dependent enzyme
MSGGVSGGMSSLAELGVAKYLSLTSYKKDGTPVATPVWAVRDGDALAVWTVADSWKVRRIRRDPRVTVAVCDLRGRPTGEPVAGRAEIISAEDGRRVRDLIRKKYGLVGRLSLFGSRLRRGVSGSVVLRVLV